MQSISLNSIRYLLTLYLPPLYRCVSIWQILHGALGLVKTNPILAGTQQVMRNGIVWGILYAQPSVSPFPAAATESIFLVLPSLQFQSFASYFLISFSPLCRTLKRSRRSEEGLNRPMDPIIYSPVGRGSRQWSCATFRGKHWHLHCKHNLRTQYFYKFKEFLRFFNLQNYVMSAAIYQTLHYYSEFRWGGG